MKLVRAVYELTQLLPDDERFVLVSQMRRAAISIPSNIADGSARQTKKDSIHFYIVARGSLSELDTQLELCLTLGFVTEARQQDVSVQLEKVGALLNGLIRFKREAQ